MLIQAYHKGPYLDLSLLIFSFVICSLMIWMPANYADDTSPYTYDLENEKVIKLLEKLFDWFSDNVLKANSDTDF